ncbi:hypothetical protein SLE2022_403050 [Rubroshorea leprosula]|uniref:Uncharacterized protein n=1 Tax=Rubroshorea leprosula TaxID=152421 RepID=A0AAV5L3A9_9ROSI|nr:hypothetical protein SLEP1_g39979 [Rubroshorea leprosula]
MSVIHPSKFILGSFLSSIPISAPPKFICFSTPHAPLLQKSYPCSCSHHVSSFPRRTHVVVSSKSPEAEELPTQEDEWLDKLPDKNKPLYSHSLPCIEAWLSSLGFQQSREDRAVWLVERSDWHAQLSLDITDLYIRYLKSGPGNLERDVERRFSYALSRQDIENAILGGP